MASTTLIARPSANLYVLDADRFAPNNRRRRSGPGLRTFLAIAERWQLAEQERLLILRNPSRSIFYNWRKTACDHRDLTLPTDTLIQISAVILGRWFARGHERPA